MALKSRPKRGKRKAKRSGWWSALDKQQHRRVLRYGGAFFLTALLVCCVALGLLRLDAMVTDMVAAGAEPAIVLVDLPDQLAVLAGDDLYGALAFMSERPWTTESLCCEMANSLAGVGWVAEVNYVRRTSDAEFQISCRYRLPAAMVQQDGEFFLVDAEAVRLPGVYRYDPQWQLVQGVSVTAPPAGTVWDSAALHAGLVILKELADEAFRHQITAVLVENFEGRVDRYRSHIELATDRAGGRIRWGSAPGLEMEENFVGQKLAILRANFQRSGRVDEEHPVIDVSTFADRYTIPG